MLPQSLVGSYRRYKNDTNVFISWLCNNHEACQQVDEDESSEDNNSTSRHPSHPPKLTGKARKEEQARQKAERKAKNAKRKEARRELAPSGPSASSNIIASTSRSMRTAKVTTREIEERATALRDSARVTVPVTIQRILTRAIEARRKCADWYKDRPATENFEQDQKEYETHDHFIKVLEDVRGILSSYFEEEMLEVADPESLITSAAQLQLDMGKVEDVDNENPLDDKSSFTDDIKLDDDLQIDSSDPIVAVKKTFWKTEQKSKRKKGKQRHKEETRTQVAVDINDMYELEMADEEELRILVYCLFQDMARLRDFVEETWILRCDGGLDHRVAALMTDLVLGLVERAVEDVMSHYPDTQQKKSSYEAIFSVIYPLGAEGFTAEVAFELLTQILEPKDIVLLATFSNLQRAANYFGRKETSLPNALPTAPRSWFDWDLITGGTITKQQDELLTQFMLELEIEHSCKGSFSALSSNTADAHFMVEYEDRVTESLWDAVDRGNVSFGAVFAARVLLDINIIMGGQVEDGYLELLLKSGKISLIIGIMIGLESDRIMKPIEAGLEMWGSHEHGIRAFNLSADALWISNSANEVRKSDLLERIFDDEDMLCISKIEHLAPKSNPVYCGLEYLNLGLKMEQAAIDKTNTLGSVVPLAHLDNAGIQTGLLEERWLLLDHVIDLYKQEVFKDSLPLEPKDMLRRLMLSLGITPSAMAAQQRANRHSAPATSKNFKSIIQRPELSIRIQEYLSGAIAADRFLFGIPYESKKVPSSGKYVPIQLQMLVQLKGQLPEVLKNLDEDMISLTTRCNRILLTIQQGFKSRLGKYHEILLMDSLSPLQAPALHLWDVHEILSEAFGDAAHMAKISTMDGLLDWRRSVLQNPVDPKAATAKVH